MWLRIVVAILLFIILIPILLLIPVSFSGGASFNFPPQGFSLKWYELLLNHPEWLEVIQRSLMVAFFTALLASVLGVMAAVAANFYEFPGKKIFINLVLAPMTIPAIIVAIALFFTFSSYRITDTILGLVLGHTILAIPFVFTTVLASLSGIDRNLLLAAQSLGSTPIGAFFKITLPLIRPALMAGFVFAFVISLDEVVVSIFLTGPSTKTLPIKMWENFTQDLTPAIAAISSILIIAVVLLFVLFPRLIQIGAKQK